ncbi:osmoprotectant transport system permease protein [Panacagrimonas perspica]|uniref:Osmoprotectant transport system permease protein n=1 Tax=Panacagrimonas perspica TaxID=381431 RepID=A0A4R7PG50_9GAMM|nr:glycine betaine ABC transporter substrate-binding protein [Panacagrimonas perspica]TDU32621.1 osmoprotectant transport system permease protein [Panacagrimonas perspica]THD05509.1 amino acid ABC transporter permease [Panacagrimonas perspica]
MTRIARLVVLMLALSCANANAGPVVIGSKAFTESVILGELATQMLRNGGIEARHQRELGGTAVLWSSLRRGDLSCYAEYTGTLRAEIYAREAAGTDAQLAALLQRDAIWASPPIGFNDTYVLGMRKAAAQKLSVMRMSDLVSHPGLRLAFSNEFLDRADGWPGLRAAYGLPQADVRGMDHDLAYRALAAGSIDVTDLYSTDAEIAYYDLVTLQDDRHYFPAYDALFLCRADVAPDVRKVFEQLAGTIDAPTMARLNAQAKLDHVPEAKVAQAFIRDALGVESRIAKDSRSARLLRRTLEHLSMVGLSLLAAVPFAVALGVLAFRRPRLSRPIFAVADVLQTIPALALLVFLIPWLGIGYAPAVTALFVYSLLPILRNTHAGLADIPQDLRDSADALGLSSRARLRFIEMPLAARSILAGIKTAAVINVGTATLGALIGAGGYGQSILTGIRLDDHALILEGAVPAALLALAVQWAFGMLERRWVRVH